MIKREDLHDALQRIERELAAGRKRFIRLERQVTEVAETQRVMKDDVSDTKDIVEAWSTVRSMARFLKWASGSIAALMVVYIAIKAGIAKLL